MSDIADGQNISDDTVAVTVDGIDILFDVLFDHCSLKFRTLICVKTYIIGIIVEIKGCHIQLSCGTVGRLTVKPYQRFVLICHRTS